MNDALAGTGSPSSKRVVAVIGAGYAGVIAANRLRSSFTRQEAARTDVVIINPTESFIERIRLHQVAAGTIPTAAVPLASVLHPDVRLLAGKAVLIDPVSQIIEVRTNAETLALHYELMIYAVGSRTSIGVPGADTYAYPLADADGAFRARSAIEQGPGGKRIVIVGGGFTSVEAASEIAEQHPDAGVILVCGGELAESMTPRARASIRRSLNRLNVTIRSGERVAAVTSEGAVLESGELISADVCIWSASFAVPELAAVSGLATDGIGRLRVDSCLRSVDYANVIGAGDAIITPAAVGGHLRMGCAAALPLGGFAARTALSQLRAAEPEPASVGFVLQCLSLGRRDSYIQVVGPDDSPRRLRFRGRTGAWIKEAICRMTVRALQKERLQPGAYKTPKGPRIASLQEVSTPPGPDHDALPHP
jgi:NADH dehydrogenase